MTIAEAIALEHCPQCGGPVMKVPETGLVACLASTRFLPCKWMERITPYECDMRKDKMTRREKENMELQARIERMREENA